MLPTDWTTIGLIGASCVTSNRWRTSVQAIVIYSNLSLDKNKRWRTVGGLAHSRVGLGLVRPPLPSWHWESLLPC